MNNASKKVFVAAAAIAVLGTLAFGGGKKDAGDAAVIRVGTEGAYPPYNYVDAAGKVDGYDAAVIRAVDALLPEYTFEFVPTAWEGIFVALEGGDYDLIASNLGWRKEREEKYYLSKEPYLWSVAGNIVFKAGRKDIKSLADLTGKNVAAGIGTSTTTQLEEYAKEKGLSPKIVYTDGNIATALLEIDSGRVDATLSSIITTQLTADSLGLKVDAVPITEWPVSTIHLLYPKTPRGEELRNRIDTALVTLQKNGTLSKLSKQYFNGRDYSTEAAAKNDK
jgi:L-cystine transport system substrate-binding protein